MILLKKISIVCMLIGVTFLFSGCGIPRGTATIGQSGRIRPEEKKDVVDATAAAKEYMDAWVNKDYRKLYKLKCPHSMERSLTYDKFEHMARVWREKGIIEAAKTHTINFSDIESSLSPIVGINGMLASGMLMLAVSDDISADDLKDGKWPYRAIFFSHKIGNDSYILMVVKEKESGRWAVMGPPGQLDMKSCGFK